MSGVLFVVATPIGNLEDVSKRALAVLAAADIIACEDTRHSRRLLDAYGISTMNAARRRRCCSVCRKARMWRW